MKFNCKSNQMILSLDNCAQLEIILYSVCFAAFNSPDDDTTCSATFGANQSDIKTFFDDLNVAIDPDYQKGSYEAAFRALQAAK
jgi:hypothetical protein